MISSLVNLETNLSDIKELIEITGEDNLNENDYLEEINNFEEMIEEIENEALYFGEYDDLNAVITINAGACLLYTSPSPRDATLSRMPSSA